MVFKKKEEIKQTILENSTKWDVKQFASFKNKFLLKTSSHSKTKNIQFKMG